MTEIEYRFLSPLPVRRALRNLIEVLFPRPVRARMKVRVHMQRAILRAIQDSASAPNACSKIMQSSQVRKRMKMGVLMQRFFLRAIQDSASVLSTARPSRKAFPSRKVASSSIEFPR
jgi:hypothetical protein